MPLIHTCYRITDVDRSIAFYRGLLGFTLVHTQEQANEYTSRLVGYPGAHLKVAQFALPGQLRGVSSHDLELVEYVYPRGKRGDNHDRNPISTKHIVL